MLAYFSWLVAVVATSGSLYFSEVLRFPPCLLCWYQRVLMYPLVLIIAVGILKKDENLPHYVLPLSIAGGTVALYHNLLYYGILPQATAPCLLSVSCTTRFFAWFGFVTIPLLSLVAFTLITSSMIIIWKLKR